MIALDLLAFSAAALVVPLDLLAFAAKAFVVPLTGRAGEARTPKPTSSNERLAAAGLLHVALARGKAVRDCCRSSSCRR